MRRAILLSLSLIVGGCVPTADFVELRDQVRQILDEKRKLRETEAELRKRLEDADRLQKPGDITKQLDVLEAKAPTPSAKPDDTAKPRAGGLDAPTAALTPTAAYNQAYNDYLKGNYDLAVAGFEEFLKRFPETSLTAHAQYWIGEAYFNKRSYSRAIEAYERVIANYPKSDKVPAALAKAGVAYAEMGNAIKARVLLKRVVDEFPQSAEATLARRRLAELR